MIHDAEKIDRHHFLLHELSAHHAKSLAACPEARFQLITDKHVHCNQPLNGCFLSPILFEVRKFLSRIRGRGKDVNPRCALRFREYRDMLNDNIDTALKAN